MMKLEGVKDYLFEKFGSWGHTIYYFTMERLGAWRPNEGYLSTMMKTDLPLPFAKVDLDGSIEFGNLILGETTFAKIDPSTRTVEGYAITCVADAVDDLLFPESYQDSLASVDKRLFLMHDTRTPMGKTIISKVDEIGWYVKDEIDEQFWTLVESGVIKGFSVAGGFVWHPKRVGSVNVYDKPHSVKVIEHSGITNPCNKLAFFQSPQSFAKSVLPIAASASTIVIPNALSQSSNMTEGNDVNVANNLNGNENMSTEQKPNPPTQPEPIDMNNMTSEQILEIIRKNEASKLKGELIKVAETQKAEATKSAEESRYKAVIDQLAKEKATREALELENKTIGAKVAIMEEKFAKLENLTIPKTVPEQSDNTPKTEYDRIVELTTKADHQTVWNETEKIVRGKKN